MGNWVTGEKFFDREDDLSALLENIRSGTHTLLTAQRRMGKTSLIRETLRRLDGNERFRTIFVDLEDARDPADAIVEIRIAAHARKSLPKRAFGSVAMFFERIKNVKLEGEYNEFRIRARAEVHAANWKRKGDSLLADLTRGQGRVVLAIDEFPLLVNKMLVGHDYKMLPERVEATNEFLSWLRRNAQTYRDRLCLIVSGSVGITPILRRAGLTATLNVFSVHELMPWSHSTASECLGALARTYGVRLPLEVRDAICDRLRYCIPHQVQQFFEAVYRRLTLAGRVSATHADADGVYREDMLGARGQIYMDHYFDRLKTVLGDDGYTVARELLALAVDKGSLSQKSINRYQAELDLSQDAGADLISFAMDVLEQDGYFTRHEDGFRFTSGLLEDWLRVRTGRSIDPLVNP